MFEQQILALLHCVKYLCERVIHEVRTRRAHGDERDGTSLPRKRATEVMMLKGRLQEGVYRAFCDVRKVGLLIQDHGRRTVGGE